MYEPDSPDARLLDDIPRVRAGYRAQFVDALKGSFMKGTREGLFEELGLWLAGGFPRSQPKRFYLLSGSAGLGKSSFAHQLCVRLDGSEQTSQLGASYFFVGSDKDLSSSRLFFSTLVHQLALSQSTLYPHIVAAEREYLMFDGQLSLEHACKDFLRTALSRAPASDHPVVLVIDALDECKELWELGGMLRLLLELVRAEPWLYVFVTSRPEPHVMAVLTSPAARDVVYHRRLDDAPADDVKLYLEQTIPKIPSCSEYLRSNPNALVRLAQRADGRFAFASLAVNFLDACRNHVGERFKLLFSSGDLPSILDALFLQVLRSAFPPEDLRSSPNLRERLLSLLAIIALQEYPLTIGAIALLDKRLSERDISEMVGRLRSIIFVDAAGTVLPLHTSFPVFLLDEQRCHDPLYHVDRPKCSADLASACLAAFSFEAVTGYLAAQPGASFQYVHYATQKWAIHLKHAEFTPQLEKQLRNLVLGTQLPICSRIMPKFSVGTASFLVLCFVNMAHFLEVSSPSSFVILAAGYSKVAALTLVYRRSPRITNSARILRSSPPAASFGGGGCRRIQIFRHTLAQRALLNC